MNRRLLALSGLIVNTQTVRVLLASKFLKTNLPKSARCMHMDHECLLQTFMPPWRTRYTVSGDVLFVAFVHYSPDVPCDFANFVDHLTFHWCVSSFDDVDKGLDHHASPLAHYLICP